MANTQANENEKGMTVPPEFLSTHPSYESRIAYFERWMPEAQAKYNADAGMRCRKIRQDMKIARRKAAEHAAKREM